MLILTKAQPSGVTNNWRANKMSITPEVVQGYLDKIGAAETYNEKGYLAAELYCKATDATPEDLKKKILQESAEVGALDLDRKAMDFGGIKWCDEQIALRS